MALIHGSLHSMKLLPMTFKIIFLPNFPRTGESVEEEMRQLMRHGSRVRTHGLRNPLCRPDELLWSMLSDGGTDERREPAGSVETGWKQ